MDTHKRRQWVQFWKGAELNKVYKSVFLDESVEWMIQWLTYKETLELHLKLYTVGTIFGFKLTSQPLKSMFYKVWIWAVWIKFVASHLEILSCRPSNAHFKISAEVTNHPDTLCLLFCKWIQTYYFFYILYSMEVYSENSIVLFLINCLSEWFNDSLMKTIHLFCSWNKFVNTSYKWVGVSFAFHPLM